MTDRHRRRSYGRDGYGHGFGGFYGGGSLAYLLFRWIGNRHGMLLWRIVRWWGKAWVVVAAAAVVRFGPAWTGLAICGATWVVTAYSDRLPPRWPRWTVPVSWTVLTVGTLLSLSWVLPVLWYWLPSVVLAILAGTHRGIRLRCLWRPAGLGAGTVAAWSAAPWSWRARTLALALVPGGILAALGWAAVGALLVLALVAVAAQRWRTAADQLDALADHTAALAHTLHGTITEPAAGTPWHPDAGAAPVEVIDVDPAYPDRPAELVAPLPPGWQTANAAQLDAEIRARLHAWGEWSVIVDPSARQVHIRAVEPLPHRLGWDGTADLTAIRIGVGRVPPTFAAWNASAPVGEIRDAFWRPTEAPHLLIVGPTGAGKSVAARAVIAQWVRGRDHLGRPGRAWLLDPKRVEFALFRRREGIAGVAVDLDDMDEVVTEVRAEMMRRFDLLTKYEAQHVDELPPDVRPDRCLVVVDEAVELLELDGLDDDERDQRKRIRRTLTSIARLGRAAAVHLVLLAQRPDAIIVTGQLRHNLQARLLCGPAEPKAVQMVFGEAKTVPNVTPGVRGRGRWTSVGEPAAEVQGLWISTADLNHYCPRPAAKLPAPTHPAVDPADQWMTGHGHDPTVEADDDVPVVRTI